MNSKKGFTLMELLAVIVILAIIALIATPAVLNLIENSKESAARDSAMVIGKAAETYYMSETTLQGEEIGSIDLTGDTLKYKGEKPEKGYVSFDDKGNAYLKMYTNGYCVESNYDNTVESEKTESEDCEINTVSIPLNLDGGILDKTALTYEEGSTLGTLPEPTKEGYIFKGWYDGNGNPVTSNTVVVKGLRLTASWEANTYTVTFKNGEEIVETREVTYGQEYGELPTVTSSIGVFKGWYSTNGVNVLSTTIVTLAENHILTAQWESPAQVFSYTGGHQKYTIPVSGNYKIELWGAGGSINQLNQQNTTLPAPDGFGAYTSGTIYLEQGTIIYIYVGQKGDPSAFDTDARTTSYNGGGANGIISGYYRGTSGSGATDVRIFSTTYDDLSPELLWNSDIGLKSRIMVAAGGAVRWQDGGGLIGYTGENVSYNSNYTNSGTAGTQTKAGTGGAATVGNYGYAGSDGSFGIGGTGGDGRYHYKYNYGGPGGSGGYYGGGGAGGGGYWSGYAGGGGSGSSFISGHTGCVALASSASLTPKSGCTDGTTDNACSIHYSGYSFTNTKMIDGKGKVWTTEVGDQEHMPNPNGGYYELGYGHNGHGYARITFLG